MSTRDPYDNYDEPPRRSHRSHHDRDRRDDREPRYVETQETYVRAPAGVAGALVRQPVREDSDLSVEEVRRDFPPPGYGQRSLAVRDGYGPVRARSAERSAYGGYRDEPRRSYNDLDDRRSRKSSTYLEQEVEPRRRSLSRNQKIIAAVGGAALAVGGKEIWDRRQAGGDRPVARNPLATAAVGAAGAFAGYEGAELYAKHAGKKGVKEKTYIAHRGKNGEVAEYYDSASEEEKPKKSRRKSIVEGALGLAGLGAAAGAAKGSSRDKSRGRHGSPDSGKSGKSRRGKSPEGPAKFQQAAKAALLAGATEAFRVRKEPGGWGGAKGKRILTAAIGAGGIDAAADRNPDHHTKRHILEAVVGGLAGNRLINGSRNNVAEDDRRSRSRSRARSRSRGGDGGGGGSGAGLAALATAGIGALAGKKLLDRSRSRDRRGSPDSYDSRSPSPKRDKHKRSKSVSDYARKGLASLGIGGAAAAADDHDRRRGDMREVEETTIHRRSRRGSDDDDDRRRSRRGSDDDYDRPRNRGGRGEVYGDPRYADSRGSDVGSRRGGGDARAKDGRKNRRIAEGKQSDSESSYGSSSGDEKKIKKMKGKQLITAGLATVATIHAAHNIYQSMEKREARHKAVQEGEMSPEEARKLKAKATLQDAASVGIAALGIKGAISEIKEANEMRHECKEFREKKAERHLKRLERQKKSSSNGSSSGDGRPSRRDNYDPAYSPQAPAGPRYGPRYADSNPYSTGALPAPPVGYSGR